MNDDERDYAHEVLGAWNGKARRCVADVQILEDARLISAAPDLLEACQLARHICEDGNALQQLLDSAIAKAVGPNCGGKPRSEAASA